LALYMVAQIWGLNLPNIQASRVWFFNPLAWQFIFVGGVVLAHLAATGRLETLFRLRGVVVFITTLASAYVLFSLLSVAPWRQIPALANLSLIDPADLPVADKTNLTVLRLVDGLAKAWLLAVLIPRAAAWLHALPARMLAVMGRQSLPVFVLGLVLSTVCGVILRETGFVLAVQIAVLVGGSAILIGFAALLDWQARMGRRDAAIAMTKADTEVRPAPGPSAPLAKALAEPSTQ
jgi:hypothetical protein